MKKLVLLVVVAMAMTGCGTGKDQARGTAGGVVDDFPCTLISKATLAKIGDTIKLAGYSDTGDLRPTVGLMEKSEHFVDCAVAGEFLQIAVRAVPDGQPIETVMNTETPEPLAGVGDSALIGQNSFDGLSIGVTSGSRQLVVFSEFNADSHEVLSREALVAIAKEAVAAWGTQEAKAIALPRRCPGAADDLIASAVDQVAVARGRETGNGSLICEYAGAERHAAFQSLSASPGEIAMQLSDSGQPVDVDDDSAYFQDDDTVVLVVGSNCALVASASPMGYARADQRPAAEIRADTLGLVKKMRDTVGCPD